MLQYQEWRIRRPGNSITLEEWQAWLTATPGFSVTNKVWGANPMTGRPINLRSPGAGLWVRGEGKSDVYFDLRDGTISPIQPDEETIAKLPEIAAALGAELIQSDD